MGFEVVVRPAVFPNIRPVARAMLPPDAPDKGVTTISGTGGSLIELSYSYSYSNTFGHQEVQRKFEKVRVPYTRADGTLDWSNYTEFEIVTNMSFTPTFKLKFDKPIASDSLRLMGEGIRSAQTIR